jgi:PAS domain S-box-containing protein
MVAVESARELAWIRSRVAEPAFSLDDAAVIVTNLKGLVAHWNAGAEQLYGWTEAEALGRDILDLTPAKYTRGQAAKIMAALQAGGAWRGEILLRHRDGSAVVAFVVDIPAGDLANGQGAIIGVSTRASEAATLEAKACEIGAAFRARFAASAARGRPRKDA